MITLRKKPMRWVSAHRPVEYEFDFETQAIVLCTSAVTIDATKADKMAIQVANVWADAPQVGGLIFITSGTYAGYHVIDVVADPQTYITKTDYTVEQDTGNVKLITEHTFTISKGTTNTTQSLNVLFPWSIVAEFKPEPNREGKLNFSISGYIDRIFDVINSNLTATVANLEVYYNLFNVIYLHDSTNGVVIANEYDRQLSSHMALNCSIDMFVLNRDYVNTGKHLNSGNLGNHFLSCGITHNIILNNWFVYRDDVYDNGATATDGHFEPNSWNDSFFKTNRTP